MKYKSSTIKNFMYIFLETAKFYKGTEFHELMIFFNKNHLKILGF